MSQCSRRQCSRTLPGLKFSARTNILADGQVHRVQKDIHRMKKYVFTKQRLRHCRILLIHPYSVYLHVLCYHQHPRPTVWFIVPSVQVSASQDKNRCFFSNSSEFMDRWAAQLFNDGAEGAVIEVFCFTVNRINKWNFLCRPALLTGRYVNRGWAS